MKTYYDLKKEERKNYYKEFKKTPVGKELNFRSICILIITVACWFVAGFVSGYQDGSGAVLTQETELFINAMYMLALVGLLIYTGFTAYVNINFSGWLKNKHDIKRW